MNIVAQLTGLNFQISLCLVTTCTYLSWLAYSWFEMLDFHASLNVISKIRTKAFRSSKLAKHPCAIALLAILIDPCDDMSMKDVIY